MLNYTEAKNLFDRAKDKMKGKPLAKNTRLLGDSPHTGAEYYIRFHNTDIIWIAENSFTLYNGGYFTKTTKERLNEFSPARLFQEKKKWYIADENGKHTFFDGITVDNNGVVINPLSCDAEKIDVEKRRLLDKKIKNYIDGFCRMIENGNLEYPSGGDCWFCSMFEQSENASKEHIFSHFEENYYVPSLLFNAIKSKNYRNPELIFNMIIRGNNDKIARMELRYYFRKIYYRLLESM